MTKPITKKKALQLAKKGLLLWRAIHVSGKSTEERYPGKFPFGARATAHYDELSQAIDWMDKLMSGVSEDAPTSLPKVSAPPPP